MTAIKKAPKSLKLPEIDLEGAKTVGPPKKKTA